MKKTKVALVAMVVLSLVVLPWFGACAPKAPPGAVIKLGFNNDLTGPYASVGVSFAAAHQDYIWYINEKKGGVSGIKLEYVWGDSKLKPPEMVSVYERLKAEGVMAQWQISTGHNDVLASRITEDKFPTIAQGPSKSALENPYMHMIFPFYVDLAGATIDVIAKIWKERKETRPAKVAFITADAPLGKEYLRPEIMDYARKKGMEVVAQELIPLLPIDTTPQLIKARDAGANFIIGNGMGVTYAPVLKDSARLGILEKVQLIGPIPASIEEIIKLAGGAAEGYIMCRPVALWEETGLPCIKEMAEGAMGRRGEKPPYSQDYIMGYVHVKIMEEAIKLALKEVPYKELTREKLWKYGFQRIKDLDVGGAMGKLSYDKGPYGQTYTKWAQVKGGKGAVIADWTRVPNLSGTVPER